MRCSACPLSTTLVLNTMPTSNTVLQALMLCVVQDQDVEEGLEDTAEAHARVVNVSQVYPRICAWSFGAQIRFCYTAFFKSTLCHVLPCCVVK